MVCSIRSSAVCLALLVSGLASAAPSSAETLARAAAAEAKKAFDLGDWAQAIEQYEAAYKLKPVPGLLFNLGQSHRRAGHLEQAAFYFRRYLESNPPEAQAKATEEVLTQVEAQRVAQADETQRRLAAEQQQRLLELEKTRLAVVNAQQQQLTLEAAFKQEANAQQQLTLEAALKKEANAQQQQLTLEAALKQEAPPPPVYQRWWFWTSIGAVVVGGAVTATLIATAPQPLQTTFPDINAR